QVSFYWNHGSITGSAIGGKASSLQFSSWRGRAEIAAEVIPISGTMQMAGNTYFSIGTANFAGNIDLRLTGQNSEQRVHVTGTIEAPVLDVQAAFRLESASNEKNAKPAKTP